MSILPEKLVEFFSLPSSETPVAIEIPAEAAELAIMRSNEIRGAVVSILNVVGGPETIETSISDREAASIVGRVAGQAEVVPTHSQHTSPETSPEVKIDPTLPAGLVVPEKQKTPSVTATAPSNSSQEDLAAQSRSALDDIDQPPISMADFERTLVDA